MNATLHQMSMIPANRSGHSRQEMPADVKKVDPTLSHRVMACFLNAAQAAAKARDKTIAIPEELLPDMRIDSFATGESRRLVMMALQKEFNMGASPLLITLGDICQSIEDQKNKDQRRDAA